MSTTLNTKYHSGTFGADFFAACLDVISVFFLLKRSLVEMGFGKIPGSVLQFSDHTAASITAARASQ